MSLMTPEVVIPTAIDADRDPRGNYVDQQVPLSELPLYEQAARQTDYRVDVKAREGKPFNRWGYNINHGWTTRVIIVTPGFVGIHIVMPEQAKQPNFQLFWNALADLRSTPQPEPARAMPGMGTGDFDITVTRRGSDSTSAPAAAPDFSVTVMRRPAWGLNPRRRNPGQ